MQIAVVSDTHVPERADEIPGWVRDRVADADHAVHAGDFTAEAVYEEVRDLAGGDLTAVFGNMDPRTLDLPAVATLDADGVTLVVTHGTGSIEDYEERVTAVAREEGGEDAVAVAGHTHRVTDELVDGTRLLNPGSATGAAPAEAVSMMELVAEDGDLEVTVHER